MTDIRFDLPQSEPPRAWCNINTNMPVPMLPPLHPGTQEPVTPEAEGILPAPETNHAVRSAINEARACKESGDEKVVLFNLSGHGNFDMAAYAAYHEGRLERYEHPEAEIVEAMTHLPAVEFAG